MATERFNGRAKQGAVGEAFLTDLKFQIARLLCLEGIKKESAIAIVEGVSEHLMHQWGGMAIYIPKKLSKKNNLRNIDIYAEYKNGRSCQNLACKHGLSVLDIGKILHKTREQIRLDSQRRVSSTTNSPSGNEKHRAFGQEFLEDIETEVIEGLCRYGVHQQLAMVIGTKIYKHLAHCWAGISNIYIPTMIGNTILERNAEIYTSFKNGASHRELAAKHNITPRQIYDILKKVREQRREEAKRRVTQTLKT
ncbi:hypothetical protein GMST_35030 [Geomonas silvestris]|uniref:Mor transcription activator domain-containing protein n=1 Tax=Geomonas silvestris TaxID=2740184 RepID=A0A6V8MME4_9BACT|nr:Mor transcription activator family protein [Geomonas silvestris]GFO61178.1 hypothetical protein GMST_35030 [Geomonas silvestris]